MNFKFFTSTFLVLFSLYSFSQNNITVSTINPELLVNANAVVRKSETEITIISYNKMLVKHHRIVTVLNEKGDSKVNAYINYDGSLSIKKLEAKVYNASGKEIKKFKKKDFEDVSVADGVSIFNDNRALYINYTPTSYPYTVEYYEEYVQTTTAFMPYWFPLEGYYISTEYSSFKIINESGIKLRSKATNFENHNINAEENFYTASNLKAIKHQAYSPSFRTFAPHLKLALEEFEMKGVKGTNLDWKSYGKWVSEALMKDTELLPQTAKDKVLELTADAKTDLEKAKIVYEFMQNKTRYISVQVGIGGWKPMLASDVDKLGYGDCKALSNYTKSLLDVVGVESYYTLIYGGRDIINMDKDFSSQQGNHAILAVPNNDELVFLECTSQTVPFGYTANFTDDRDVLIIKPEGGEIVHTKVYQTKDNLQTTNAKVNIDETGNINANLEIVSKGTQYGFHERIERETKKKQDLHYKNYFDNINNLEIVSTTLKNDKDAIAFTENIELSATKYASKAGNRFLFAPNLFNRRSTAPPRYIKRKLPFEVDRGYTDVDEYEINFSEALTPEHLPEKVIINNQFGSYEMSIKSVADNKLVYKRKLIINKGKFIKEDYKAFRDFYLEIVKHDKQKIVLKTK